MAEPIGVAVMGTGWGTRMQVPAFQTFPDTRVVAVVSARQERADEAARRFGIPHAFTDYRRALDLPEVDAVSVASPPYLHRRMTLDALAAGKHVICEKPMAMDIGEAREIVAAWRESGKVGMMDFEFRFVPARQYVRALIQQGYVGRPLYALMATFRHQYSLAMDRPWGWIFQRATGGGFLGAMGSHSIDNIQYWLGEIRRVTAVNQVTIPERRDPATGEMKPVETEDAFVIQLELASGAQAAIINYMTVGAGPGNRYEVYGTEGGLIIDNASKVWGGRNGGAFEELAIPDEYARPDLHVPPDQFFEFLPFTKLLERFVDCIRNGKSEPPTFDDGVKVQEVMDAIRISEQERRWIDLPL